MHRFLFYVTLIVGLGILLAGCDKPPTCDPNSALPWLRCAT